MNERMVNPQTRYYDVSLAELMPPLPLSENLLHDIYTRCCLFSRFIGESICRELGWTQEQLARYAQPPQERCITPLTAEERKMVLAVVKARLKQLLQYLEDCPGLHDTLQTEAGGGSLFGAGRTREMRPAHR